MEIKGKVKGGFELDKRTYLPGVSFHDKCPKCGAKWKRDLGDHYLSYPEVGKPIEVTAYCNNDDCRHEWAAGKVILSITLTAA